MKLERKYIDEEQWKPVGEGEAKEHLLKTYLTWEWIWESLKAGRTIYTSFAQYRMVKSE